MRARNATVCKNRVSLYSRFQRSNFNFLANNNGTLIIPHQMFKVLTVLMSASGFWGSRKILESIFGNFEEIRCWKL